MSVKNIKSENTKSFKDAGTDPSLKPVAKKLSAFLASTYMLYQKSLFYHWNVTGENFVGLHELFEKQYEELHKAGDEIAERIRALGFPAPGTFHDFRELSEIDEDDRLPENSVLMVKRLLKSHETCSKQAAEVNEVAEKAGDVATADMMVDRIRIHDKAAWMLSAILE